MTAHPDAGARPTTLALTGATGFVGGAVLARALASGMEVRALARSPQPARAGVTWIAGDLADADALARLTAGAEAVLHVAALTHARDPAAFAAANVAGTLSLVEAAVAAGVPRLVFVSSLAAREPGLSAYGASKAQAERLVRAAPLSRAIVRPPAVYGPGDRDMLELFRAARWGVVPMPASGRASVLHVGDLARLLLALLPTGDAWVHDAPAFIEPDDGRPGGWSHEELALAIGAAVGRRPRALRLSRRTMEWASRADTLLRRGGARLTGDRVSYLSHPDWVSAADARPPRALWQPLVDTPEGLEATARWYRAHGWL